MQHVQTIQHIKVMFLLAFEACNADQPRGILSEDSAVALDELMPQCIQITKRPNELSFYIDNHDGRKLNIGFEAAADRKGNWGISWAEQNPNSTTQDWAHKYTTYSALMHAAKQWLKEHSYEL